MENVVKDENRHVTNWKNIVNEYYETEAYKNDKKYTDNNFYLNPLNSIVINTDFLVKRVGIPYSSDAIPTHYLNGSICLLGDRLLYAYRSEQYPFSQKSLLHITELDFEFQPVRKSKTLYFKHNS